MKKIKFVRWFFVLFLVLGIMGCSSEKNEKVFSKDLTKVINSLYPNIILDYQGVSEEKIIQDFGQPNSKEEAIGFIDGTHSSEGHFFYNYAFDNGVISFYINKKTRAGDYVEIFLIEPNGVEIFVPGLINKGGKNPDIVLGRSTFGDIFGIMNSDARELTGVLSYKGGSAGNDYTNLDFYFGKYGEYHEFTFAIPGLYDEAINEDYKILSERMPRRILVK